MINVRAVTSDSHVSSWIIVALHSSSYKTTVVSAILGLRSCAHLACFNYFNRCILDEQPSHNISVGDVKTKVYISNTVEGYYE